MSGCLFATVQVACTLLEVGVKLWVLIHTVSGYFEVEKIL